MPVLGTAQQLHEAPALVLRDAVTSRPVHLTTSMVEGLAGLESLQRDWQRLALLAPAESVFQSYDMCHAWARKFIGDQPKAKRLCMAVVSVDGQPVMIVAVSVSQRLGIGVGRLAGAPIAQYGEILADPRADLEGCLSAALEFLKQNGVDVVLCERVRDDSLLNWSGASRLRALDQARSAPFVDLGAFTNHENFLRSRSKNLTKSLRNRRNQLDKVGPVTFETLTSGPEARTALASALDLKRDWLAERGTISSAFADTDTIECLLDLAEHNPQAMVMRMLVDGRPAAIRFGFAHSGTFFSYLSAYDPEFAQYSPGKLLMAQSIADVRTMGLKRFDMLPPAGEHKDIWCDAAAPTSDYALPLTRRGTAFMLMYKHVRPIAKAIWLKLPHVVRTAVVVHLLAL